MRMSKLEPLFLKPVLKETIWGGTRLSEYGYELSSETVGEAWVISAHPHGDCVVKNGFYAGCQLSELWSSHRELFGNLPGKQFPLMVKMIDARQDLSVQVHPDDVYAALHESGSLGKTECWLVLDCEPGTEIVIGHRAGTRQELCQMIDEGRWEELIRRVPVKPGNVFQINPGCVHAIQGGTLILETQQSSDITYRLYDYGRLQNGRPRPLHLEQSKEVIRVPFVEEQLGQTEEQIQDAVCKRLVCCSYYCVEQISLDGQWDFENRHPFVNVSVLEGSGFCNEYSVKKGDHLILPAGYGSVRWRGKLELILSWVPGDTQGNLESDTE